MNTKESIEKNFEEIKTRIYTEAKKVKNIDNQTIVKVISQELGLSEDTLKEVASDVEARNYYKKKYKMLEYLMKESGTEVSLIDNLNKAKRIYKSSDNYLQETLNKAKFESFINTATPDQITPEVIDYLKENDAEPSIKEKAIQKFVSSLQPDQIINNDVFDFLYDNNYESNSKKLPIDLAYDYYCEGKKKDEKIKELENKIAQKDEIIVEKEKTIIEKDSIIDEKNDAIVGDMNSIRALNLRIKYYEDVIPNVQLKMVEFARAAQRNVFNIIELRKQEEDKERRGIFSRIAFKVKSAFRKEKPLLLSSSLHGIQNDMNKLTAGLAQVGESISEPESQENLIEHFQRQKQVTSKIHSLSEIAHSRT